MRVSIKIEPAVPVDSKEYNALLVSLTPGLLANVPLKEVRYVQVRAVPPLYQYSVEVYDGREWKQILAYLEGFSSDPVFSLPTNGSGDRWKVSELLAHDKFLKAIIALTLKFGITAMHIEWVP